MNPDVTLEALAIARLEAKRTYWWFMLLFLGIAVVTIVLWALLTPGQEFWPIYGIIGLVFGGFFWGTGLYGKTRLKPWVTRYSQQQIDEQIAKL